MIISFSGTDGAGKSTQINKLMLYFQSEGKSAIYLWSRGGYTPLFSWAKSVLRKLFRKKLPEAGLSESRDAMIRKGAISRLWLIVAMVDLFLLYVIYVRLLSFSGRVVICDRYIEDTFLDFTHNFGGSFNPKSLMWRALVYLSPKPGYAFLLTVPVDVSKYRSNLKNEPFPDTPETLEWRLNKYMDEASFPSTRFYKIDCQQSVEDIYQIIKSQFNKAI